MCILELVGIRYFMFDFVFKHNIDVSKMVFRRITIFLIFLLSFLLIIMLIRQPLDYPRKNYYKNFIKFKFD